ncbi:hypothetical protein QUA70_10750 [Microcoleus sp. LAD1_D5]|uniref:hypothetical protein n=1 Tax=unclassified Microcoleus TaxID=2642155 RepID=UPI002FCFFA10
MKAAKPKIGAMSQESGVRRKEEEGRRKEEEGRSQNKCFYKYEMLPKNYIDVTLREREIFLKLI